MKQILLIAIIIQMATAIFASGSQPITSTAQAASAVATPDVTVTQVLPFGALVASATTTTAKTKIRDWQDLSPINTGDIWYFRLVYKNKPEEIKNVTGYVAQKIIDGKPYYYYSVPAESKKNLVRFTNEGAYIRGLTYPLFDFIFLDVTLNPEIQYLRFPIIVGDSWTATSTGRVTLLDFININRDTTIKFHILGEADILFAGKKVHVFKVQDRIDKGNGQYDSEETWYGEGIGLVYQETEAYILELYKFEPGSDNTQKTKN